MYIFIQKILSREQTTSVASLEIVENTLLFSGTALVNILFFTCFCKTLIDEDYRINI